MARVLIFHMIILLIPFLSSGQMIFQGIIKDRSDSSILQGATARNLQTRQQVAANDQGIFSIPADFDDRIIITAIGYLPDTILVKPQLFLREPVIFLRKAFSGLESVTVYADHYQVDSLESREYYNKVYKSKNNRMISRRSAGTGSGAGLGFGLILSPVSYFSTKAKAHRRLVKRLQYNEEQGYVDHRFSSYMVSRYTGLKGDSLRNFMMKYRPSYKYCVKSSDMDILFYINDRLKEFLNRPPSQKVKPVSS